MKYKTNYKIQKYKVFFCELGAYDSLDYSFDKYEDAIDLLRELENQNEDKSFFGYIAEIKLCRSLDNGKERDGN